MLKKTNRLTTDKDFDRVKKHGKLLSSVSFSFVFAPREDESPSKFGFIVSKKISLDATVRNRAKRALREAVRTSMVYIKPGFDGIFLAKPIIARKYTQEIIIEVKEFLQKSGIFK